jgi:hypothetical protein
MLPRWFFVIFGQGGQCKLHWPQNLVALPKDGAGLASQRGGGQPPNCWPLPPRATGGRCPQGGNPQSPNPRGHGALTPRLRAQAGPGLACRGLPRDNPDLARPALPGQWARAWGVGRPHS